MELLRNITTSDLGPLTWQGATPRWEPLEGGGLRVYAPAESDYFQDPSGKLSRDWAPFLSLPVTGDFCARACVRPTFSSTYDAGALMVRHDRTMWAKICYESTDFGTHAAVSVVTNGVSDDANGANLETSSVWLQIVRQANVFAMHYSLEGTSWKMVRYFALPVPSVIQVGLVAQSPIGTGTEIDFCEFLLEKRAVGNVRAGI